MNLYHIMRRKAGGQVWYSVGVISAKVARDAADAMARDFVPGDGMRVQLISLQFTCMVVDINPLLLRIEDAKDDTY